MPVGPTYKLGESRPGGPRGFTDREQFIEAFERAVSELPPEEYRVLVYYGVGGIGKTSLRTELSRLLQEQHPQIVWAVLDFVTPTHRDVETALFWLRQELNRKYEVQFPSFELAYALFWQKSRPQTPLRKDSSRLEALIEQEGSLPASLLAIAEGVPIVSLVPKVAQMMFKTDRLFREWWTKRVRQELYELEDMAPGEISARLPMFWAADLKDFMQRESRPVVLFIDTYEALWEGQRTEARFFAQDAWVRELVAQLPEVLWVIAGREKLRWEEDKPDWGNYLEQQPVGQLAENDCREFLASCEITEEALQRVIVEGSKGVPFYLDASVDTYLEIKKQGKTPSPSDFGKTQKKVVDRFLSHLEESEEEILRVLSVARFWDRTLFKLLIKEFATRSYSATALSKLRRFSFIQEEQVPGMWTIHPLMREGLEGHQDAELRREVHQHLFDHYKQQLQGLESMTIGDLHKTALTEAFHYGKHALTTEEFVEWFTATEEIFEQAALWQFLIPLYEEFAGLMEDRLGPEHPGTASSLNNLAVLYYEQGRYEEAEPLYERALRIREKVLGPEHPDTAQSLNNLAVLYEEQGRYEEAEPLHERALGIRGKVLGLEHSDTAGSLNNLAELYRQRGRYEEAESLHERALGIREKIFGPEHPDTASSLNNLAGLYMAQGYYEESQPLYERALRIREKVLGSEHPHTAQSLNNLAELYRRQGRYEEAEPLHERSLGVRKILGLEHPDTAQSLNNLALLYYCQGRYEEAEPLFELALGINEKVFGPEHPNTIKSLNNLAGLYAEQGCYEEAEPLYERALRIREKILGLEHPDTTSSLNNLALLYKEQGRYEEAEPLYERALGIQEEVLGPEHPDTALSLNNLAQLYRRQGRCGEAEPLHERALGISEKVLGPEHPDIAISLNNLASLYAEQGRYEEAEPIYQRALRIQEKKLGHDHPDTIQTREALEDL